MRDLKRLIWILLMPLIAVNIVLLILAAFLSFLLYAAGFEEWCEYPTIPFAVLHDSWMKLVN